MAALGIGLPAPELAVLLARASILADGAATDELLQVAMRWGLAVSPREVAAALAVCAGDNVGGCIENTQRHTTGLKALPPTLLLGGLELLAAPCSREAHGRDAALAFPRAAAVVATLLPRDSEYAPRFGNVVVNGLVAAVGRGWADPSALAHLLAEAVAAGACPEPAEAQALLHGLSPESTRRGCLSAVLDTLAIAGSTLDIEGIASVLRLYAASFAADIRLPGSGETLGLQRILQATTPSEALMVGLDGPALSLLAAAYVRLQDEEGTTAVLRHMRGRGLSLVPAAQAEVAVQLSRGGKVRWGVLQREVRAAQMRCCLPIVRA